MSAVDAYGYELNDVLGEVLSGLNLEEDAYDQLLNDAVHAVCNLIEEAFSANEHVS
jgi:hypothetical protein